MDREDIIRFEFHQWNNDERTISQLDDEGLKKVGWIDFSCRNCEFSLDEVLQVEDEASGDKYTMCPKCDFLYAEVDD